MLSFWQKVAPSEAAPQPMKVRRLSLPELFLLLLVCGCSEKEPLPQAVAASVPCERSVVLANLPVNSDQQCMGIAIVIEAMLEADSLDAAACLTAQSLADRLYLDAASAGSARLPQFIDRDGERMPLLSRPGMELLCTLIADRHKQDFARWTEDPADAERLAEAQMAFVPSGEQLRLILRNDSDHAVAFGGPGIRLFPDSEERETHHAFVLQAQPDGRIVVYDPNDPRSALPCRLEDTDEGVLIEWTCQYRDTGARTTQAYYLVPVQGYLAAAFSL